MIDEEDIQNLFEDKYQSLLGMTYQEWQETGPQTEEEAYARLQEIDDEIKGTEDEFEQATGIEREEMEEYRERLRNEYQLIEEVFGLEPTDE